VSKPRITWTAQHKYRLKDIISDATQCKTEASHLLHSYTLTFNPCCKWGREDNLPPRPSFVTIAPKLLGFFCNDFVIFPINTLATEPQKNFSLISYYPLNFGGKSKVSKGSRW